MRTSHKLTRLILALMTLIVLSTLSLAQTPADVRVSDQKAGSVLVFPYYYHHIDQTRRGDTRISISNIANAPTTTLTRVHLFLLSGANCTQADLFLCLTPNATATFKTGDYDPLNSGYIIAVAVDADGRPTQNNVLIGNAFVRELKGGLNYEGNYGAEAFWRNATGSTGAVGALTANLAFGTDYDGVPDNLVAEIQSPLDSQGQRIVAAGLTGNLNTGSLSGCAQRTTGAAFNQNEKFASFQGFLSGNCLCDVTINSSTPRVPGGLANPVNPASGLLGFGVAGTLKIPVTAAVGLIMTPREAGNGWTGIRTLHKITTTTSTITIPIFTPVC